MEIKSGESDLARSNIKEAADKLTANVAAVIVGKKDITELILVALLSEGHVLLEDIPGVGKTILARSVARSLGCNFKRLQCTPDLLPSDVTGLQFYNQKTGAFEFRPGPIMTNILLVDEINRATPRTQSALLEAMQEKQITVDMDTVHLPQPFLLIATQNPIELEGTFPLPEAQLDRFLFCLKIGYPSEEEEDTVLTRFQQDNPLDRLEAIFEGPEIVSLQRICRRIFVEESLRQYILAISRATRNHREVKLGASPRASLGLHRASQVLAAIRGRGYVAPDDIKYLASPALAHRLIITTEARLKGRSAEDIIKDIVATIPVPVEDNEKKYKKERENG